MTRLPLLLPIVVALLPATPAHAAGPAYCLDPNTGLQSAICATPSLAVLAERLQSTYRADLRASDPFSGADLAAGQRRFLAALPARCRVLARGAALTGETESCLDEALTARIGALAAYHPPPPPSDAAPARLLIRFTPVPEAGDAGCAAWAARLDPMVTADARLDPSRLTDARVVASSAVSQDPASIRVVVQEGTAYDGYELRIEALADTAGRTVLGRDAVQAWATSLSGPSRRFADASVKAYQDILVIDADQTRYALALEPWGYDTPTPPGGHAFAALYALGSEPRRTCLFQTFERPADLTSTFAELPPYAALRDAVEAVRALSTDALAAGDRLDDEQLRRRRLWFLEHLSGISAGLMADPARLAGLRRRHDAALDALFAWSEGDVPEKRAFRRLIATLSPAVDALAGFFAARSGLPEIEARRASEALAMALTFDAASAIADVAPRAGAAATYPIAARPIDLLRGRTIPGLYSAVLNDAPIAVVQDFLRYEQANPDRRSVGRAGATPLMAAVGNPDMVRLLLGSGADVNARAEDGSTALIRAARHGKLDTIDALLAAGADRTARDGAGEDACAGIARNGDLDAASRAMARARLCAG